MSTHRFGQPELSSAYASQCWKIGSSVGDYTSVPVCVGRLQSVCRPFPWGPTPLQNMPRIRFQTGKHAQNPAPNRLGTGLSPAKGPEIIKCSLAQGYLTVLREAL